MTKEDIVNTIKKQVNIDKHSIEMVIKLFTTTIMDAGRTGDHVTIKNFGTFETKQRKERMARNPKTGERVLIPEKRVLVFRPSKKLRYGVFG